MTYNTDRRKPLRDREAFLDAHGRICYFCGLPITDDDWDDEHRIAKELMAPGSDWNAMSNRAPIHRNPCHKTKTAQDRRLIAKSNRLRRKFGLDPPSTRRKKPITNRKTAWPKRSMEKRVR